MVGSGERLFLQEVRLMATDALAERRKMRVDWANYHSLLCKLARVISHAANEWHKGVIPTGSDFEKFLTFAFGGGTREQTYGLTVDATALMILVGIDEMSSQESSVQACAELHVERIAYAVRDVMKIPCALPSPNTHVPTSWGPVLIFENGHPVT